MPLLKITCRLVGHVAMQTVNKELKQLTSRTLTCNDYDCSHIILDENNFLDYRK